MEIEINGELLDLGNSEIALTKKSVDINEPVNRFITFSNSFDLPKTNNNSRLLEAPDKIGTNNLAFENSFTCQVRDLFFIFKGKGFVKQTNKDSYSIQLVENSKDLFNFLKSKLSSLNWDLYDKVLTSHSQTSDIEDVFYWGNFDMGNGIIRPLFFFNAILKRAITDYGYIFTSPAYELLTTFNHEVMYFTSYQKTITGSKTGTLNGFNSSTFDVLSQSSGTLLFDDYKGTQLRLRGNITSATTGAKITFTGVGAQTVISETFVSEGLIDFTTSEFDVDQIITITITGTIVFDNCLLYSIVSELDRTAFDNYLIKVYDNLPDYTFFDIFKIFCIVGNYIPNIDSLEKTFAFKKLSISKVGATDWSDKFIQQSEIITTGTNFAKTNLLTYKNDLSVPAILGSSNFLVDNDNLINESTYIELPFSATTESSMNIYPRSTLKLNARLLQVNGINATFTGLEWESLKNNYFFDIFYRIRLVDCLINLNKLDFYKWNESDTIYIDYFKSTFMILELNDFISGRPTKVKMIQI